MHFLLLLPAGLSVGHQRHKVLRFLTACYTACAGPAEQFGVLPLLFMMRSCLVAITSSHWSNMPVLAKVNPAIWQQLIVAQSNSQSWVALVHKI